MYYSGLQYLENTTMRSSDWAGSPPENDGEAEHRLLQGALECAREFGINKINIKRVAEQVGIARQTVYRYFSSSDALIESVTWLVVKDILDKLNQHVKAKKGFENKVIESVLFLTEEIPNNDFLSQYFSANTIQIQTMEELFDQFTLQFCIEYLRSLYGSNSISDEENQWLSALSEHLLRTILVMVITPSERISTIERKRDYLQLWLSPVLRKSG